jgi:desulfoferrodoxin (superoxide reductase-like protein)
MKYLLLFVLLIGSSLLLAHPASNVELEFNAETSILTVNFDHKVKDAAKHFIFEIKVYLNKEEIIEQKIEQQDDAEKGTVLYKIIDAKAGDKIKVRTICNKTGKKSASITIE